jgi:hypothetical protein
MKSRKWEAVQIGLAFGVALIVGMTIFWVYLGNQDTVRERNHYREMYTLEQETTQLLMQNTVDRIKDHVSYGTDLIDIEIPCTVDKGVVHQVMYRVVR